MAAGQGHVQVRGMGVATALWPWAAIGLTLFVARGEMCRVREET